MAINEITWHKNFFKKKYVLRIRNEEVGMLCWSRFFRSSAHGKLGKNQYHFVLKGFLFKSIIIIDEISGNAVGKIQRVRYNRNKLKLDDQIHYTWYYLNFWRTKFTWINEASRERSIVYNDFNRLLSFRDEGRIICYEEKEHNDLLILLGLYLRVICRNMYL
jgi:hypothetical protein